jgi:hypothetical protein
MKYIDLIKHLGLVVGLAIILIVVALVLLFLIVFWKADYQFVFASVLAFAGFLLSYSEFHQWRIELIGGKRIELSIRLAIVAASIERNFYNARHPIGITDVEDSELTDEQKKLVATYKDKIQPIIADLKTLYQIRYEVEALSEYNIMDCVDKLNTKHNQLNNAMGRSVLMSREDTDTDILFRKESDDIFAQEIREIADCLKQYAKKIRR